MTKKVAFIMAAGHSGSSLLALILGSHPRCFSAGEIQGLSNRYRKNLYIDCVNRNSIFWEQTFGNQGLRQLAFGLAGIRVRPFIPLKAEKWVRGLLTSEDPVVNPYLYLFSKINSDVLVDSSKGYSWIKTRLSAREFTEKKVDGYLIHLVRDGRAVVNSFLRKYPNQDITDRSTHWVKRHQERKDFFEGFPEDRKIEIRYEHLASDPSTTVKKICDFLGLDFDPDMLEYWKHEHHDVSGNDGTYSLIDKYKGLVKEDKNFVEEKEYYKEMGLAIRLDVRWRKELSEDKVSVFNRIAGDVNKPYEWNE